MQVFRYVHGWKSILLLPLSHNIRESLTQHHWNKLSSRTLNLSCLKIWCQICSEILFFLPLAEFIYFLQQTDFTLKFHEYQTNWSTNKRQCVFHGCCTIEKTLCATRSVDKEMTECSGSMEYRNVFGRYEKASPSTSLSSVYMYFFRSWSASGLSPSRVDPPWYCLFDQCLLAIITYCFPLFSVCMFIRSSVVKPTYV